MSFNPQVIECFAVFMKTGSSIGKDRTWIQTKRFRINCVAC